MKDNISSSPILNIVSRILFAPIIIFGLYVQFHGDYGPGEAFKLVLSLQQLSFFTR